MTAKELANKELREWAESLAREWLESYGIRTAPYTRSGGDHPAMHSLPETILKARASGFAAAREGAAEACDRLRADRYNPEKLNTPYRRGCSDALDDAGMAIRAMEDNDAG